MFYMCVCVSSIINYWVSEPVFMAFNIHIIATEPISMEYFIQLSHQFVCLNVLPKSHCYATAT
jgi:hypothetical protein